MVLSAQNSRICPAVRFAPHYPKYLSAEVCETYFAEFHGITFAKHALQNFMKFYTHENSAFQNFAKLVFSTKQN